MWHNIEAGRLIEGGSTITQQLAKNMYFSQEKKFTRKVAEVFVAQELEDLCDKKTLFELYVNSIYFGAGYYNIYDAAHGYYDKDPSDLNDYESTMLAGIPNAPSVYAPTVNPKLAEERRAAGADLHGRKRLYHRGQKYSSPLCAAGVSNSERALFRYRQRPHPCRRYMSNPARDAP